MDHLLTMLLGAVAVGFAYNMLVFKQIIREFECGLLYRSGRYQKQLGPGAHRFLRSWNKVTVLDLWRKVVSVPGQEVLTADQVGLKVSLVVTYQIVDAAKAVHHAADYAAALYVAAQLALRKVVASLAIDQLLEQRVSIGPQMTSETVFVAEPLGVQVLSVEVKDIMLPADVRKAFSEVVRARKEGQAALERARGETAAIRNLANAARMVSDNPALLNLRFLQALSTGGAGQTMVLNVPDGIVPLKSPSPEKPSDAKNTA